MGNGSGLGRFDERGAQLLATGLGDFPGAGGEALIVDASPQARIAHQMFGVCEASDLTNRSHHGQGDDHAKPRQMDQAGHTLILRGYFIHQSSQAGKLGLCKAQGFQVTLQIDPFQLAQRQSAPPGGLIRMKEIASRRKDVMALQNGVQTVFGLRGHPGHLGALRDQGAQLAHFHRWHPNEEEVQK